MAIPKTARVAAYLDDIERYRGNGYPWAHLLPIVQRVIPDIGSTEALRQAVIRARHRRASGSLNPEQYALPRSDQTTPTLTPTRQQSKPAASSGRPVPKFNDD